MNDELDIRLKATRARLQNLMRLKEQLAQQKTLSMEIALESEPMMGEDRLIQLYFQGGPLPAQYQASLEAIDIAIIGAIAASAAIIVAIIARLIAFFKKEKSDQVGGRTFSAKEVKEKVSAAISSVPAQVAITETKSNASVSEVQKKVMEVVDTSYRSRHGEYNAKSGYVLKDIVNGGSYYAKFTALLREASASLQVKQLNGVIHGVEVIAGKLSDIAGHEAGLGKQRPEAIDALVSASFNLIEAGEKGAKEFSSKLQKVIDDINILNESTEAAVKPLPRQVEPVLQALSKLPNDSASMEFTKSLNESISEMSETRRRAEALSNKLQSLHSEGEVHHWSPDSKTYEVEKKVKESLNFIIDYLNNIIRLQQQYKKFLRELLSILPFTEVIYRNALTDQRSGSVSRSGMGKNALVLDISKAKDPVTSALHEIVKSLKESGQTTE